jgi:hypothetical protein
MPRQAAAASAFAANGSTRQLIQPPSDLNALEKAEFVSVVLGSPASHFLPADVATISAYARAVVAERIADGELSAAPVISGPNGDRASPWLAIWISRLRAVTTLARRLNIGPSGRVVTKPAEPDGPTSYYSRMAMESKREPNGH